MKRFKSVNDADYIKNNAKMIEMVLESFGIPVRVVKINIQNNFYEYCIDVAVGSDLKRLERHDRDLAIALASPTGKVFWQIPVPGKSYVILKVPKPSKEYFEEQNFEEEMHKKGKSLRDNVAFVFFLLGELNYWIARKIFDKDKIIKIK